MQFQSILTASRVLVVDLDIFENDIYQRSQSGKVGKQTTRPQAVQQLTREMLSTNRNSLTNKTRNYQPCACSSETICLVHHVALEESCRQKGRNDSIPRWRRLVRQEKIQPHSGGECLIQYGEGVSPKRKNSDGR